MPCMKKTMTSVDDLTLLAYVDGELDAATARAVEEEVRGDPQAARRVRRLRESSAVIRAAVNEPIHGPVPHGLIGALSEPVSDRPRRRRLLAAGAAALAAAGFGGAYFAGTLAVRTEPPLTADEELVEEIVSYHSFYAEHPPPATAQRPDPKVMEAWLGRHLQQPVHIPDLSGKGLHFQTARLFVYEDRPIAQIVYESPGSPPVALCIVAARGDGSRPFESMHRRGFNLITWERSGSVYLVVGAAPESRLRSLSTEISTRLHQS